MKDQYITSASISVSLKCLVNSEEPPEDVQRLLSTLLQHSLITQTIVWGKPTWQQIRGPWMCLADSPFEPGDVLIHGCSVEGIGRMLLAQCTLDETQRLRIDYLPNATDEHIERRVYEYIRATYPSTFDGFFSCPTQLLEELGLHT